MRLTKQEMKTRNRFECRRRIFAGIECRAALAKCFDVITLEAKGEPERKVATAVSALREWTGRSVEPLRRKTSFQRKICLRAGQRWIQRNCPSVRFAGFFDTTEISEDESGEIVRIRICRVQIDRAPEETQCFFSQSAIVKDLRE